MVSRAQFAASASDTMMYLAGGLGSIAIIGVIVLLALRICLRGTTPEHRPAIIKALAELFRGWFGKGPPNGKP